ncbi:dTMP kinase [Candidatus Woesearchaeota archaeon]|nr:dTMP kinase [Candidatus Woesearchaeota archaeon]
MGKSLFIVIDGLDGSGKGEMVKRLHNYLYERSKCYLLLTTREPTSGKYGRQIRKMLKSDKDPKANARKLLHLYIKDREDHLKSTINPFLSQEDGDIFPITICDRYYYSTIAYQGLQGIPIKEVIGLNSKFRKPDIAFILDVPEDVALGRIRSSRASREKFEDLAFMGSLRQNFLALPKRLKDNIRIIGAGREVEEVFEDIRVEVNALLHGHA